MYFCLIIEFVGKIYSKIQELITSLNVAQTSIDGLAVAHKVVNVVIAAAITKIVTKLVKLANAEE